jgi:hypothetical protein
MWVGQIRRVDQIRRKFRVVAFNGITFNIGVGKKAFDLRLIFPPRQPQNDHMHMGHAPRIAAPGEGRMSKREFQMAAVEQQRPKLRDLLPLGDGIGRHKADFRLPG